MIYRKGNGSWCVRDDRGFRKFNTEKAAKEYLGVVEPVAETLPKEEDDKWESKED